MLISKLQEHFPARTPEWANGLTMFAWGLYILLHPGLFEDPIYRGLVALGGSDPHYAERVWGTITLTVGMVRLVALFINGAHTRTPAVRLVTSALSAFVWSQILSGLLVLDHGSTGIVMYSSAVVLDLLSAYRAACDVVIAENTRRVERGHGKRGRSSSYTFGPS